MKKILSFYLFLLLIICLVGCGKSDKSVIVTKIKSNDFVKSNISETLLYDQNNIKLTAKKIIYGSDSVKISLFVENDSDSSYIMGFDDLSINDIMIKGINSIEVASGKKANYNLEITKKYLNLANITSISNIEFYFHIIDSTTYKDVYSPCFIELKTDATDYKQDYSVKGDLVLEAENIKIYVLKLDQKTSEWGADLYIYIENNSDRELILQTQDVSINELMIKSNFSAKVLPGKKAFDTITFYEQDLIENGINDINNIELKFVFLNDVTWNSWYESDSIKMDF